MMIFVIFDRPFELGNCFCESASLCKDHTDQIEDKWVGLGALIQAFVKIAQSTVKITQSIVKQSSNHKQRRVVFNRLNLIDSPHRTLQVFFILVLQFLW